MSGATTIAEMSTVFDVATFPPELGHAIPPRYVESFDAIWANIARSGRWFTGEERTAIAAIARHAEPLPLGVQRPAISDLETDQDVINDTAARVASNPGALSREWFDKVTARIGLGRYAELVAIVAQVVPIDRFCDLLGRDRQPFLPGSTEDPSGGVPADVADDGAWLPMTTPFHGANVARSLSYVPEDNMERLRLVRALYSGTRFGDLIWDDGALSRPQVELLAARTSALNECFY